MQTIFNPPVFRWGVVVFIEHLKEPLLTPKCPFLYTERKPPHSQLRYTQNR